MHFGADFGISVATSDMGAPVGAVQKDLIWCLKTSISIIFGSTGCVFARLSKYFVP
jgi:hypothetical protein